VPGKIFQRIEKFFARLAHGRAVGRKGREKELF
jgi:hypothetical protein